jgi:hypothetical protein
MAPYRRARRATRPGPSYDGHPGAAEASGVARWCLETAVEYAKVREQFGQKIGASRRSSTCARRCSRPRGGDCGRVGRGRRGLRGRRASGRTPPTSPRSRASTARSRWPSRASRCSAGSASPTSTTPTSTCAGRWPCGGWSATRTRRRSGSTAAPSTAYAGGRRRPRGRDDAVRPTRGHRGADRGPAGGRAARALVETGYLTPHWPAPYGLGADAVTQIVIDEELAGPA